MGLFIVLVAGVAVAAAPAPPGSRAGETPVPPAAFVGRERCAGCHPGALDAWRGSQHAQAMQVANEQTVLGDFNDATLTHFGVSSRFFRRDGQYFVTTEGPDGQSHDYPIAYTFGVFPLQQYLIAFPGGRMQALSIAWDSRPRGQGGGRWFHLYPDERITPTDPLHWTQRAQNWNWMCAECHSTNLRRNYDPESDSYRTTWSELEVSCEACHGPGSQHLAWVAQSTAGGPVSPALAGTKGLVVALDERRGAAWGQDAGGNPVRSPPLDTHRELDLCAQCHARRAPFADGFSPGAPLMETHDPALLMAGLYFADGQQQDEVYTYGSFLQSRMYARGVTCSDCHEPHGGKPRAPGNALCAGCHAPARYDRPAHTLHAAGTPASQCTACHLPTRTYMGVDARHDHSFRVPRPDLAQAYGTPEVCTGCHRDRDSDWAASVISRAFGPDRKGFQSFGGALQAGRMGAPGAGSMLAQLVQEPGAPAIARATAVRELEGYLGPRGIPVLAGALKDQDPLVRGAALETLLALPPGQRAGLALPLLEDPVRVVRIKAARTLAPVPIKVLSPAPRAKLEAAFQEYLASQKANAERPEAHLNLGLFHTDRQQFQDAEAEYRAALRLDSAFAPAWVNLADLYRATGREADAEFTLLEGLNRVPRDGALTHALGLLRARQRRTVEALRLLERAVALSPDSVDYAYVLAVALHDTGEPGAARAALGRALERFPNSASLLAAAADYAREAGDGEATSALRRRLAALSTGAEGGD